MNVFKIIHLKNEWIIKGSIWKSICKYQILFIQLQIKYQITPFQKCKCNYKYQIHWFNYNYNYKYFGSGAKVFKYNSNTVFAITITNTFVIVPKPGKKVELSIPRSQPELAQLLIIANCCYFIFCVYCSLVTS